MEKNLSIVKPYKSSLIHKVFNWIDRLPGPYWLFYIGVVVLAGLANHIVAWNENEVAQGEFNLYYGLTAFFLGLLLFETDFTLRILPGILEEFIPLLKVTDDERDLIFYKFSHLPSRPTAIAFISGGIIGFVIAWNIFPTAIEMNNSFPELEIPVFTLSFAIAFVATFHFVRGYLLTVNLFERLEKVNLFNPDSLYAMSRYSVIFFIIFLNNAYFLLTMNPSMLEFSFQLMIIWSTVVLLIMFYFVWFPVRRVNRMLVLEKKRLISDVNLQIQDVFDLHQKRAKEKQFGSSSEIQNTLQIFLAKKEYIKSLRTWPWHPGTIRGLVSLTLIPVVIELLGMILSKIVNF